MRLITATIVTTTLAMTPLVAADNEPVQRLGAAAAVFQTTWRVAVCLASDVGTATDQFDTLLPQLCDALQAEIFVDSARPLTIPTEAGTLYGLELIGRSE